MVDIKRTMTVRSYVLCIIIIIIITVTHIVDASLVITVVVIAACMGCRSSVWWRSSVP